MCTQNLISGRFFPYRIKDLERLSHHLQSPFFKQQIVWIMLLSITIFICWYSFIIKGYIVKTFIKVQKEMQIYIKYKAFINLNYWTGCWSFWAGNTKMCNFGLLTLFVQPIIYKHYLVSNCKLCSRCVIYLYYKYLRMVSCNIVCYTIKSMSGTAFFFLSAHSLSLRLFSKPWLWHLLLVLLDLTRKITEEVITNS